MTLQTRLLTDKTALNHTRTVKSPLAPLQPGEAILRIDRVAVTTNNITYAAFGDAMRYWDFFPTGEAAWGHMPAWGFAEVVESDVEGVAVGERFYGYWPIATHLRMQPVRVTKRGFYDGAEHRQELTSAYNQYTRTSTDAAYRPSDENYQMLVRPLFITSFMLADFLQDNAFFGAKRILYSSASSKTAYGTAFCLTEQDGIEQLGLTSSRNRDFVQGLGCYQDAVVYENLETLDSSIPTLYVDFSGEDALRARVHHHFGEALVYDCYAGSAQNTHYLTESNLPGPVPAPYFAPIQIRKRNADWGPEVVNQKFNAAQRAFIDRISDASKPWVQLAEHQGFGAAQALVKDLCAGRIDPKLGHIVVLNPGA